MFKSLCNKFKQILSLCLVITLFASINVFALEKGSPDFIFYESSSPNPHYISKGGIRKIIGSPTQKTFTALFINGTFVIDYDVIIRNDRSLVPVRLISESLNSKVSWDDKKKAATIQKDNKKIVLTIGSKTALVNNKKVTLDSEAVIYNSLTYVPLRFIAENLDAKVEYVPVFNEKMITKYFNSYFSNTKIPVSASNSFGRGFANIVIDEKYDFKSTIEQKEAESYIKQKLKLGLENQKKHDEKMNPFSGTAEDKKRYDTKYQNVSKDIDQLMYLGEVSRYYKYTIGMYDVLIDRFNKNIYLVTNRSNITKFDENSGYIFWDGYFAG